MRNLWLVLALGYASFAVADINQQRSNWQSTPDQQQGQQYYRTQSSQSNQGYYNNQMVGSDDKIAQQIRDVLKPGWVSKGYDGVFFEVNNGYVTLQGVVNTPAEREKVEKSVRDIKGVSKVENQITVNSDNATRSGSATAEDKYPQDYAATDADFQLNKKIRDRLKGGWISKGFDGVILKTSNGIVIITGNVDKPEDVQKVTDAVKKVQGVRNINNQLQINNSGE